MKTEHEPTRMKTGKLNALQVLADQEIDLTMVDTIIVRVALYEPITWQAVIKCRDRTKVWGVGIDPNPGEALRKATENYFGISDGPTYFHQSKEGAEEIRRGLVEIYGQWMYFSKVEFEPYKGYVIVVQPKEGEEKRFRKILDRVELRKVSENDPAQKRPKARKGSDGKAPETAQNGPGSAKSASPGIIPPGKGGKALSRGDMEALWKGEHGKFPPRDMKKLELLEALKAQGLV